MFSIVKSGDVLGKKHKGQSRVTAVATWVLFYQNNKIRYVLMFAWQIRSRKYSFLSVTIRAMLDELFNATAFLIKLTDPF